MRRFGSERMDGMLGKLGLKEGEAIIHSWINKALETAQKKVEAQHYEVRKNLLKFDDVMNDQRKVIYEQRKDLMRTGDVSDTIRSMRHEAVDDIVDNHIPEKAYPDQWDIIGMSESCGRILNLNLPLTEWAGEEGIADEEIRNRIRDLSDKMIAGKVATYGTDLWRLAEKSLLLQILDQSWKDHLLSLDHLRQGIGLRAYGQRDPLNEYRAEAFDMFEGLLDRLREQVTQLLSHIELRAEEPESVSMPQPQQEMHETREDPALIGGAPPPASGEPTEENGGAPLAQPTVSRAPGAAIDPQDPATWGRVGRNEKCPCGTGKKFKHCHGNLA